MADGSGPVQGALHLVKLCVGAGSVADLEAWQASPECRRMRGCPVHVTRMWPRRAEELLAGGSLYWVIDGAIAARQAIRDLERVVDGEGIGRCAILLDPAVMRTRTAPRRPFQGWRYLAGGDAPPDLASGSGGSGLPPELELELARIGVLAAASG